MTKMLVPFALVAVLAAGVEGFGQPPGAGYGPPPVPDPVIPTGHWFARPGASDGAMKVCATEMTPTKKVVFGSECKEYCYPRSCVADWLRACCGKGSCADCGDVRTKHVLLKKSVPGPEVPKCVLKEVPVCATPPGAGLR